MKRPVFRHFLCLHLFLSFIRLFYHVRRARITLAYPLGGSVFKSCPIDGPHQLALPRFLHTSTKQIQQHYLQLGKILLLPRVFQFRLH